VTAAAHIPTHAAHVVTGLAAAHVAHVAAAHSHTMGATETAHAATHSSTMKAPFGMANRLLGYQTSSGCHHRGLAVLSGLRMRKAYSAGVHSQVLANLSPVHVIATHGSNGTWRNARKMSHHSLGGRLCCLMGCLGSRDSLLIACIAGGRKRLCRRSLSRNGGRNRWRWLTRGLCR
jgi:hypothetical protein